MSRANGQNAIDAALDPNASGVATSEIGAGSAGTRRHHKAQTVQHRNGPLSISNRLDVAGGFTQNQSTTNGGSDRLSRPTNREIKAPQNGDSTQDRAL